MGTEVTSAPDGAGPLRGLRILDISTVLAGPLSSTFLADLGADVVKTELPRLGDPLRGLAPHKGGVPLWWKVANRNKKGVTLDLRNPRGRALFERLLPRFDVLVENFRPGTLERWGLPATRLFELRPGLIVLRVTGFGQTGPYRNKPGFARVFEALSGFTYICGEGGGPPLHMGFPISDAVAGLFGALGILSAVHHRLRHPDAPGQEIDLSATEAMFRLLDFLPVEYDQLGVVRTRSGNCSQYAAPGNVYRTRDGQWASIAASTQSIYERLVNVMDMPGLLADPRFATNPERVRHRAEIDAIVAQWIASKDMDELRQLLDDAEVGFSPINGIDKVFEDPQLKAREAIVSVQDPELGPLRMQAVVPRFSVTPGAVRTTGPRMGEHNAEVYGGLGLSEEEQRRLREEGAI
jgi:crotonobetainyl-CoA:carnitine CoA-transferase CaiB-like acyl-CoA transferase